MFNPHKSYKKGLVGAYHSPRQKEKMLDKVQHPDGEVVCETFGFVKAGQGKLSIPFKFAFEHWPKCWPCPGQETGDCVGRAGKNIGLITLGVEASLDIPDLVTGEIEGFPILPKPIEHTINGKKVLIDPQAEGVIAYENIYGERGHKSQGASCYRLINYVTGSGGIMLRQNYPSLGINLTRHNTDLAINWGGYNGGTPTEVDQIANLHGLREATECKNHEVVRDMVASGFPIWVCSDLSWSNQRDENGYSKQTREGWNHSWVVCGYDDRSETIKKYRNPLFLFIHDWGTWNSGPRTILNTQYKIPKGSFWANAPLLDRCECTALSGLNGWPRPTLPDYDPGVF